jgi:glycosyltransferase involved in cell wall biosynthesis
MEKNSLSITINGYFHPRGGWGIFNWNLARILEKNGCNVFIRPTIPLDQFKGFLDQQQLQLIAKTPQKTRVGLYVVEPWARLSGMDEPIQIAYSMVESDAIGSGWLKTLNSMSAVIVPNKFNYDVFMKCGVHGPVHIVPPSVDTELFVREERSERQIFTFGMAGYMDDRKSACEVIQSFISEFRTEKDVRLVIHSTNTDFGYWKGLKDPRITISTRPMKYDEMKDFYHSIDCYLAPSKGEGIGMTVLEAMASGLPVIGTKWGGMTDILTENRAYPLTEFELKPRPQMLEQPGNWAYPDISEIMYWMREAYRDQLGSRLKGQNASLFVRNTLNEELVAKQFIDVLRQYEPIK